MEREELIALATSLGWEVDASRETHHGLRFTHGDMVIWSMPTHWRRCQYIHGHSALHQTYQSAEEALRSGHAQDTTEGLGPLHLAVGQPVKYYKDLVRNPADDGWVEVLGEGKALFAFGDGPSFIVLDEGGVTVTVGTQHLR